MTREEVIKQLEGLQRYCVHNKYSDENGSYIWGEDAQALILAIAALREQDGSFQNGNDHNTVKDWPPYMDLPRDRDVTYINVGNKWISVEERLPPGMADVLVVAFWQERWQTMIGWCRKAEKEWRVYTSHGEVRPGGVTHWMPLPEPPKEV